MKDETNNINMINFIENYPIYYMERIGDSVIAKGTSDKNWIYISSKSKEELKIIKSVLNRDDKNFAVIEDWMIPVLTEDCNVKWKLPSMKLILPKDVCIGEPIIITSQLTTKDAEFLYNNSHYQDIISIDYICERITNGLNSCIRVADKLVAWAITQDDGAIGFLHVLPECRKKGYARCVTLDLISKVRGINKIPFVHIEESNEDSMKVAMGLGFKRHKVVSWFEIE